MGLPKRPLAMYRIVPFSDDENGLMYVLMTSDYKPITLANGCMLASPEADKLKAAYTHLCHAVGLTPIEVINT